MEEYDEMYGQPEGPPGFDYDCSLTKDWLKYIDFNSWHRYNYRHAGLKLGCANLTIDDCIIELEGQYGHMVNYHLHHESYEELAVIKEKYNLFMSEAIEVRKRFTKWKEYEL